ncbi:MAG: hypothetical protein Kow00124_22500 [Anaerolineae bacterium]
MLAGVIDENRLETEVPVRRALLFSIITLGLLLTACGPGQADEGSALRQGVVERGSIDEVVSVTGVVVPEERVALRFQQAGMVEQVFVEPGDHVEAGQPLARLETGQLELAVRQAEISLEIQELSYQRLVEPPSEADVQAARAAVNSAVANYNSVTRPADPETIRAAELQVQQAYNAYEQALLQRNDVAWYLPDGQLIPVEESVKQALIQVEIARLRLEQLTSGPDQYGAAAASASIAEAQARLDALFAEPSPEALARAQAQIDQARLALERAQSRVADATLVAPFTGVISAVNISAGSVTPANLPAITLIDSSRLHVEVDVDELDIGQVAPGQPVRIALDALPGEVVVGQVTSVAPGATNQGGVITYSARIDLAPVDVLLRPGMTVTAQIITRQLSDVLLVPNWAVRFDRETGQAYASVLGEDGTPQDVPVVLGLRGDVSSQVIAGLSEGQIVAVSLERAGLSLFGESGE